MELNNEQLIAKDKIIDWYNNSDKQVFFLSGFAGTGKSTLITYILQHELKIPPWKVKFCTPTGKAATVLLNKGSTASTIHRLIYIPDKDQYGNPVFTKVNNIDANLIVVDEFSMVNMDIFDDLLSFGIKILAVGDNAQLPPVEATQLEYLNNPDAQLTEIMRQEETSDILNIAEKARLNKPIFPKTYNDVQIIKRSKYTIDQLIEILKDCDQIIAGTNKTCKLINQAMRKYYNRDGKMPKIGDKLICLQNNYQINITDKINLVNGIIGICQGFGVINNDTMVGYLNFKADFTDTILTGLVCDPYPLLNLNSPYDKYQECFQFEDGRVIPKSKNGPRYSLPKILMNKFDYGYCITCHKAQGSEWDYVAVFDESSVFGDMANNWLYTAITRARKKLIIIR